MPWLKNNAPCDLMGRPVADAGLRCRAGAASTLRFADPDLPLAVVVAETRWDEPPRMRHDVTRQLMRWFNVLFVEFFPVGDTNRNEDKWTRAEERLLIYSPQAPLLIPVRLYANDPLTHRLVNLYFTKLIADAVRYLPSHRPILFNFVYHFPELMAAMLFSYKIYVCFDEFPKMQRRAYKRNALKAWYQATLFQHYENQVARRANRCFTPHFPLRTKLAKVNGSVEMLFHAHDFPVCPVEPPPKRSRIINVCFAGFINYRLLSDWLLSVSQAQDMRLSLIGPIQGKEMECVLTQPLVQYIPPLDKAALRSKLMEMDVLIMPYDWTTPEAAILTTNSKTFQYVATGKPVVISNLPHYIELPRGVLYKAQSAEDFVAKIRQAYYEDSEDLVRLRSQVATENSWDKRGDLLHATINQDQECPELSK